MCFQRRAEVKRSSGRINFQCMRISLGSRAQHCHYYTSILLDLCSGQITVYSLLDMIHLDSNVIENGRVHKMYVFFIFPLN